MNNNHGAVYNHIINSITKYDTFVAEQKLLIKIDIEVLIHIRPNG